MYTFVYIVVKHVLVSHTGNRKLVRDQCSVIESILPLKVDEALARSCKEKPDIFSSM